MEFEKHDDLANGMSSPSTKQEAYKTARKNLTAFIAAKKLEKRETALKAALVAARAWTVTVNGRMDSWVSSHSAASQFDALQEDIKKNGPAAGRLRAVKGSAYDWHVPGAGNCRVAGVANRADHTFVSEASTRTAGAAARCSRMGSTSRTTNN